MFKDLIYSHDINEIHTSDAYFGHIIFTTKSLIVPYINLGISNHELNKNNSLKFIDYCYFVAVDFSFLKINNDIIRDDLSNKYNPAESIYLGGFDMVGNQNIFDIEIQANKKFIQLINNSKIIDKMWTPVEGTLFPMNLDINKVNTFISNKSIPKNLLDLN
ncbi:hypothetical protein [Chryseobacterium sp. UNC8MFCol]|uniref:hypothetical protein n=1 Tax=Chryseobacterium sp. UNC8MFCol TaxID=1340435 RepID=UPI0004840B97|nr:hypothetical protein [Chryseobacterium sp. UNC8MFCol]